MKAALTHKIELFRPEDATKTVAAGEFLFQDGDASEFAYVLVEGEAEIIVNKRYASGFEVVTNKQVVERAEPGTLVGEMALAERLPRSASVKALTECRFVEIDQKRFESLVQQHPHFAVQVMQILAERLRNMNQAVSG